MTSGIFPDCAVILTEIPIVETVEYNDISLDTRNNPYHWPKEAIELLIELHEQLLQDFTSPLIRKHKLWKEISENMCQHEYNVTALQCENKWKHLMSIYKKLKENEISKGRNNKKWPYFEAMERQYGSKLAEEPSIVVSSSPDPHDSPPEDNFLLDTDAIKTKPDQFFWPEQAIRALIRIHKKREDDFKSPLFKKLKIWQDVADEMARYYKYKVTATQCENKWKYLMSVYKKVKCRNFESNDPRKWKYFDVIDLLYGDAQDEDVSATPYYPEVILPVSSNGDSSRSLQSETPQMEDDCVEEPQITFTKRRKKPRMTLKTSVLQAVEQRLSEREDKAQKRHEEFMEVMRKQNDMMQELINLLKQK